MSKPLSILSGNFSRLRKLLNLLTYLAVLGAFHLALRSYGECVLALDNNKNCQTTYQLNFPGTPFLVRDIKQRGVSQQIIRQDFDLLAAGFPCQPFSKANCSRTEISPELDNLLRIIHQKQPPYILLENVPNFLNGPGCNKLVKTLLGYSSQWEIINPKNLGIKQNRPRLFI
jgi:DNA (cytosine-5)-methyltransferase 1